MTPALLSALFAYGPYLAVFGFLGAWMYRWGILRGAHGPAVGAIGGPAEGALLLGFITLAGGHVATALAPGAMQALLADPLRVVVMETVGLVGALLFAFGVAARLRQRLRALRAGVPAQGPRVLVLALLFAVSLSGIALTVTYRWVTAWYAYISVPYVRSLFLLEPVTEAVVASPAAVHLHVTLFMALVAAWPMGGLPLEEIFPLRAVARRVAGDPAPAAEVVR